MHGHPNQSGQITSFTAECKQDVNSEDTDKQSRHSENSSVPSLLITKLYCFSECKAPKLDMTKNSSELWSESFLNKHEIFPSKKKYSKSVIW